MPVAMQNSIRFDSLPFYWHPLEDPYQNDLPESLPFELTFDSETSLFNQKENAAVLSSLERAYDSGTSIFGLMDDEGIGRKYADDFIGYIRNVVGSSNLHGLSVLEIGSGTGYLLHRLSELGCDVLGYEPGYSKIGKYDVPMIESVFPTSETKGEKFDLVIAYHLLEHIPKPEKMLDEIWQRLHPDKGNLLLALPDCQQHIENGDLSMCLHEHFSYFTRDSANRFLTAHSWKPLRIGRSGFGGSIYITAQPDMKTQALRQTPETDPCAIERFSRSVGTFNAFMDNKIGCSIGVYVPIRALNYLSIWSQGNRAKLSKLRFFDDDDSLQGKFFPSFPACVESRADLIANPPEIILIFSYSFGDLIAGNLKKEIPSSVSILTASDLFGEL